MLSIDEHKDENGVLCLRLAGEAAIRNALELRDALAAALGKEKKVRLDLAGLTGLDLTCLQLLCSAHHGAVGVQKSLILDDDKLPETLPAVLRTSGFDRCRGCARSPEPGSCLWAREMPEC